MTALVTTEIQGNPISELADRFGTPLYLYDGDVLRATYRRVRELLHPGVRMLYSAKANPNISVCAVFRALGAGMEVSSLAELVTALRAGADPADIVFVGPGKSPQELAACCEHGIHAVACESLDELDLLDALAPPPQTRVLMRVNPAFSAKGSMLSMGGKPRQFGVDQEILLAAGERLRALKHVRLAGIHVYLGTRILDAADVVHNTRAILAAAEEISAALDFPLSTVDIGGGLGVPYFDNEKELDLAEAIHGINDAVAGFLTRWPQTRVVMELGRYLAGWAGTYVVRVRYVKESRGEPFVVTDGGTHHHMAAVGIGSFVKRNFPMRSLTRPGDQARRAYTVVGPLCTPNDVIGKHVELPEVRPGDLIGVDRSGAYGPSASPVLFLSHGHPAEVLVLDGEAHLVRVRDTVDDLLRPQRLVAM
jgi:diaminopimelate decarboxylase